LVELLYEPLDRLLDVLLPGVLLDGLRAKIVADTGRLSRLVEGLLDRWLTWLVA